MCASVTRGRCMVLENGSSWVVGFECRNLGVGLGVLSSAFGGPFIVALKPCIPSNPYTLYSKP